MLKKIVSLVMICAMLIPLSPAVAADNTSVQPTIEEILNGYHQKAFDAQVALETASASTNSRQASGSSKTLEQETVDELTAAGYEAYNVTNENYNELEATLRTDFSELGLESDGSYIVVISGEDPTAPANSPRGSDLLLPPHTDHEGSQGGGTFQYEYNDTTYLMRYVFITSADNSNLIKRGSADLFNAQQSSTASNALALLDNFLNTIIVSYIDHAAGVPIGTIGSIFAIDPEDVLLPEGTEFWIEAEARWTRVYTQIYEENTAVWLAWSSTDYVMVRTDTYGEYYDIFEGATVNKEKSVVEYRYCEHYHDYEWRKQTAARSRYYGQPTNEWVGNVHIYNPYYVNDEASIDDLLVNLTPVFTLYQTMIAAP